MLSKKKKMYCNHIKIIKKLCCDKMSITLGKLKRELKLIPDLGQNRKKMFNQLCRIHNCNYNAKVSTSLLGGSEFKKKRITDGPEHSD